MSRRQKDLFPDLPDGKKYVSDIPELVADWHPTKNEGLNPEDISYGSGRKLWRVLCGSKGAVCERLTNINKETNQTLGVTID